MKSIQAINVWKDGESKEATILRMYISYDDLITTATFQYQLCDDTLSTIAEGSVNISGDSYDTWGSSGDSNGEAYIYGASQLNLIITGDYFPPLIDPISEEVV